MKSLLCLVLAITGSLTAPMGQSHNQLGYGHLDFNDKNHDDIVNITKFVRDKLALDVQANRAFALQNNNKTETIAKAIIQHVNDLNTNTTKIFEENLQKLKTHIEENMKLIINQNAANHIALEDRSKKNEEKISTETENHFDDLLTKVKARLTQHELMLDTHVAICAKRYKNIPHGFVTYEYSFMDSIIVHGERMEKNNVLDVSRGEFMAPVSGTYQIAFTAIIDTLSDLTEQLTQAKFVVTRKQPRGAPRRIDFTTLTATTGRSGGDKVPASRSLLLDLEAGEAVSIYQANPGAESSYHLTLWPLLSWRFQLPILSLNRHPSLLVTLQSAIRALKLLCQFQSLNYSFLKLTFSRRYLEQFPPLIRSLQMKRRIQTRTCDPTTDKTVTQNIRYQHFEKK